METPRSYSDLVKNIVSFLSRILLVLQLFPPLLFLITSGDLSSLDTHNWDRGVWMSTGAVVRSRIFPGSLRFVCLLFCLLIYCFVYFFSIVNKPTNPRTARRLPMDVFDVSNDVCVLVAEVKLTRSYDVGHCAVCR